jgi:hypothetical protein
MARQRASRKLLLGAFLDISVIKSSHYRLIGTRFSQVVLYVFLAIFCLILTDSGSSLLILTGFEGNAKVKRADAITITCWLLKICQSAFK